MTLNDFQGLVENDEAIPSPGQSRVKLRHEQVTSRVGIHDLFSETKRLLLVVFRFGIAFIAVCLLNGLLREASSQIIFPDNPAFNLGPSDNGGRSTACITHRNEPGICKRLPECFFVYTQLADLLQQRPCRLPGRSQHFFGVCCPGDNQNRESGVSSAGTLFFRPPNVPIPDLKPQNFQQAAQVALDAVGQRVELEKELVAQQIVVQPNTPVKFHLNLFPVTQQTIAVGSNGIKTLETSIQLVNQ